MTKNEISIQDIFGSLLRHIAIVLVVTVLFGAAAWAYTHFLVTPQYTASAKMISISNTERVADIYTSAEHAAAVALVSTTAEVIKTNSILNEVSGRLASQGLNYSSTELKKMITISSENETEVFRVIVTGTKRQEVALVANTIAEVAEERVGMITEAGSAKILEDAGTPVSPSSPNTVRNAILGALVGFVLICLIVILRDLNDTTVWTEDDLTNHFDYPVLGLIPQLDANFSDSNKKE